LGRRNIEKTFTIYRKVVSLTRIGFFVDCL
jgi:hypothetical protein